MLVVADVYVVAALSAARRRTWRSGSYLGVRVALSPVRKDWLWAICRVVDAMEEIVRLGRRLANTVLKPPEKVLDLLVVTNEWLLGVLSDLVRRDLVASLWAMQPEYS